MANETNTTVTEPTNASTETKTPTVEELMAQLANANAEKEQLKNSLSKSNSEAASYKKALREKQTAEEQEAEAKAEAERLQKEEIEQLRKEVNHNKALSAYKTLDEKVVSKLIDAVSNADHNAISQIIANECKNAVANAQVEWLENRPPVNYGGNTEVTTKEEIMKISDPIQRQKAIAENINLFRKQR